MMPFSKENNRRIYITALVISLLLIIGSIYLHLRQKTHLGRMSFHLDHDLVKPTSGVEITTPVKEYETKQFNETNEYLSSEDNVDTDNDILEASSPEDDDDDDDYSTAYTGFRPSVSEEDTNEDIVEDSEANDYKHIDNSDANIDRIMDNIEEDITQNQEYKFRSWQQDSTACLRCICMTVNECRPTFCGLGNPCGLYRISNMYWIDAGKPTIAGGTTDNDDQDYLTCINEDTCASTVIRQYYNRYKSDCNKDGIIDCRDQIALHLLGPSGCLTQNLSYIHEKRMKNCLLESNLNYFSYSSEEEYGILK